METWKQTQGLAIWTFALDGGDIEDAAARQSWLRDIIQRLVAICSHSEWVDDVRVFTHSRGSEALSVKLEGLPALLQSHKDIRCVNLELALLRVDGDGNAVDLKHGADATVWFEPTEDSSAWLALSLNYDCDAPVTHGQRRNNSEAAQTNGPKLSRLLKDIGTLLPTRLMDIEAPEYGDMVDEEGFHLPHVFGAEGLGAPLPRPPGPDRM